jgi:hypothetical protein
MRRLSVLVAYNLPASVTQSDFDKPAIAALIAVVGTGLTGLAAVYSATRQSATAYQVAEYNGIISTRLAEYNGIVSTNLQNIKGSSDTALTQMKADLDASLTKLRAEYQGICQPMKSRWRALSSNGPWHIRKHPT